MRETALKTTLEPRPLRGWLCWAFDAIVSGFSCQLIFPEPDTSVLTSLADECFGTSARLMAYVGTLALLAILGVHLWDQLPEFADAGPPARRPLERSRAHAAGIRRWSDDLSDKTVAYEIFRHPKAAARRVFRWTSKATGPGDTPSRGTRNLSTAGAEQAASRSVTAGLCRPDGRRTLDPSWEAGGVIDSKFGKVDPVRLAGSGDGRAPASVSSSGSTSSICRSPAGLPGRGPFGAARRDLLRADRLVLPRPAMNAETGRIVRPRRARGQPIARRGRQSPARRYRPIG